MRDGDEVAARAGAHGSRRRRAAACPSSARPSARSSPTTSRSCAIGYFGRDANAADVDAPTWRDRWDDPQRLPLLIRLDVMPEGRGRGRTLVVEPRQRAGSRLPAWDAGRRPLRRGDER